MALVFLGKSKCSICGLVLESNQDVTGLPHLLPPDDPLWKFSDSAMHCACYEHWEHRIDFESIVHKHRELLEQRPAHLNLSVEEIKALSTEDRARFWREVNAWSAKVFEELKELLRTLGPP